ncbi:MAG: hypothetical protein ACXW3P_00010 [Rhodospirillales bacterium]
MADPVVDGRNKCGHDMELYVDGLYAFVMAALVLALSIKSTGRLGVGAVDAGL